MRREHDQWTRCIANTALTEAVFLRRYAAINR
jgi:hypothetical protein